MLATVPAAAPSASAAPTRPRMVLAAVELPAPKRRTRRTRKDRWASAHAPGQLESRGSPWSTLGSRPPNTTRDLGKNADRDLHVGHDSAMGGDRPVAAEQAATLHGVAWPWPATARCQFPHRSTGPARNRPAGRCRCAGSQAARAHRRFQCWGAQCRHRLRCVCVANQSEALRELLPSRFFMGGFRLTPNLLRILPVVHKYFARQ